MIVSMKKSLRVNKFSVILAGLVSCIVRIAEAHHSGSMFDQTQSLTLAGTVKDYQWTSPHCWIQLVINGPGGSKEWSVEMAPPPVLYRQGWRPTTLNLGEQISVVINPLKDGSAGGNFLSARRADGQPIGRPR